MRIVGVQHRHAVHQEGVTVKLGRKRVGGISPSAVLAFLHIDLTRTHHTGDVLLDILLDEVARNLHFLRLGGDEAEGHPSLLIHGSGLDVLGNEEVLLGKCGQPRKQG